MTLTTHPSAPELPPGSVSSKRVVPQTNLIFSGSLIQTKSTQLTPYTGCMTGGTTYLFNFNKKYIKRIQFIKIYIPVSMTTIEEVAAI